MAGFRKADPKQSALKIGIYGPAGSGKTFTALLIAEGLATGKKRIAYVDTERGTDFYARAVDRAVHPEAFDFDALYTRSLTETISAVKGLDQKDYAVVVIDSVTHLWEAAINAFSGNKTSAGTIPFHAWGRIKKPYKDLLTLLLNSPMHVLLCGRQKNEYGEDDSGELKMVGVTMKAEGETPYEPHVLIQMRRTRGTPVEAYVEKDRTGLLAGKLILLPSDQKPGYTFEQIGQPLLSALQGKVQGRVDSVDEAAATDADALAESDMEKDAFSAKLRDRFEAKLKLAETLEEVKGIGKEITKEIKAQMTRQDVASLRESYLVAENEVQGG